MKANGLQWLGHGKRMKESHIAQTHTKDGRDKTKAQTKQRWRDRMEEYQKNLRVNKWERESQEQ